jgi:hypothetical protein
MSRVILAFVTTSLLSLAAAHVAPSSAEASCPGDKKPAPSACPGDKKPAPSACPGDKKPAPSVLSSQI